MPNRTSPLQNGQNLPHEYGLGFMESAVTGNRNPSHIDQYACPDSSIRRRVSHRERGTTEHDGPHEAAGTAIALPVAFDGRADTREEIGICFDTAYRIPHFTDRSQLVMHANRFRFKAWGLHFIGLQFLHVALHGGPASDDGHDRQQDRPVSEHPFLLTGGHVGVIVGQ
jgi:hypothetical protein